MQLTHEFATTLSAYNISRIFDKYAEKLSAELIEQGSQ
jgi:hypothetical protein